MLAFHERLAQIGLGAVEKYGFVLAGGYAISAHGIGDRPSQDVDLFTNEFDEQAFVEAGDALRRAFAEAGFSVQDNRIGPVFLDLHVEDAVTGEASDIQLGVNYREFPPHRIGLGPVLDIRDAVASKMSALWSRGETRDFIDIDSVIQEGAFTRDQVLHLGDEQEASPMDRAMLAQRFRAAEGKEEIEFAAYGVDANRRAAIINRFQAWSDELDPPGQGSVIC